MLHGLACRHIIRHRRRHQYLQRLRSVFADQDGPFSIMPAPFVAGMGGRLRQLTD